MEKQKLYVNANDNQVSPYLKDHFKKGCTVIVKDGSYMMDEDGKHSFGIDFKKDGLNELLTVRAINMPFPTDYSTGDTNNVLGHHNNCCIEGADGKMYYCSHINITRYEQ